MSGNIGETFTTMTRCVREATIEVFESYGMTVRPSDFDSDTAGAEEAPVRVAVGYRGDGVRGSLVLVAPQPAVKHWAVAASVDDTIHAREIVAEFTNMISGRWKGRLLVEGFPILLWMPATCGASTHLIDAQRSFSVLKFDGTCGRFAVRLDATFEKTFALRPHAAPEKAPTVGDVLFF